MEQRKKKNSSGERASRDASHSDQRNNLSKKTFKEKKNLPDREISRRGDQKKSEEDNTGGSEGPIFKRKKDRIVSSELETKENGKRNRSRCPAMRPAKETIERTAGCLTSFSTKDRLVARKGNKNESHQRNHPIGRKQKERMRGASHI